MTLARSAKELIRHALYISRTGFVLQLLRNSRNADTGHLNLGSLRDRFSYIYARGIWVSNETTPGSGSGSTLQATEELRKELPKLLNALEARSILDLGCGDFTWMNSTKLDQEYIGADIVPGVIEANKTKFPDRIFLCLDATKDTLPTVDLVMCREVLFHLSFEDGRKLLMNACGSGAKYLLLTTEESTGFNSNIQSGDYRPLNLRKSPYNFPDPVSTIGDGSVMSKRFMGLWRTDGLGF